MTALHLPRFLLPLSAAVLLALTFSPRSAHATGTSAGSALQVSVEVIRSCAVDTSSARGVATLDAARREALVATTQSSLAVSCAAPARVAVYEVRASFSAATLTSGATVQQLDIEF